MREIMQIGGPVLWVIMACGVAAFVAFVDRGFHLHRARIKSDDFLKGILTILGRNNVDEALAICEETPGPVASIIKAAILHRGESRDQIQAAVDDAGLTEISRLEARMGVIATVAQIAPLLGLLGTVLGMMTLLAQAEGSLWQSTEITMGLKQALVTTAAGLMVAVPCYAAYNIVVGKIESLVVDMERGAASIVAFLSGAR